MIITREEIGKSLEILKEDSRGTDSDSLPEELRALIDFQVFKVTRALGNSLINIMGKHFYEGMFTHVNPEGGWESIEIPGNKPGLAADKILGSVRVIENMVKEKSYKDRGFSKEQEMIAIAVLAYYDTIAHILLILGANERIYPDTPKFSVIYKS